MKSKGERSKNRVGVAPPHPMSPGVCSVASWRSASPTLALRPRFGFRWKLYLKRNKANPKFWKTKRTKNKRCHNQRGARRQHWRRKEIGKGLGTVSCERGRPSVAQTGPAPEPTRSQTDPAHMPPPAPCRPRPLPDRPRGTRPQQDRRCRNQRGTPPQRDPSRPRPHRRRRRRRRRGPHPRAQPIGNIAALIPPQQRRDRPRHKQRRHRTKGDKKETKGDKRGQKETTALLRR